MKKRKDGRYAKQITTGLDVNGKPIKKTVYGATIKEVEAKYIELKNLIEKGVRIDVDKVTVSELMQEWYKLRIFPNINPNTQKRYRYFMSNVCEYIGALKMQDVKRFSIDQMVDKLKLNGQATARDYLMLTKKFFNYAVENDIIYKNPCSGITVQYAPAQKRLLTSDELEKIRDCDLTRKDKAFLYIFRYTGMRNGEVLALQKTDINKKDMTITINKTVVSAPDTHIQYRTKTNSGCRIIPIFLPLAKALFDYIDHLPEDQEQLFLSNVGKLYSITAATHLFRRILKNCGIFDSNITPHYLRHNFISECYTAKIDIKKVQTWVGHSDVQTTLNIYTHLARDVVKDGSELNDFYDSQKEVKDIFFIPGKPNLRAL